MAKFKAITAVSELPKEGIISKELNGTRVLLGRIKGELFACLDRCPHANSPLRTGKLTGSTIQCQRHGWTFDLLSGQAVPDPSPFSLKKFPIRIQDDRVEIDIDTGQ